MLANMLLVKMYSSVPMQRQLSWCHIESPRTSEWSKFSFTHAIVQRQDHVFSIVRILSFFHITNFPFLSSNIPSSPAYGVFISQRIRYTRACSSYECFILRARWLASKLLKQGYLAERLKSSFRKFYGRYGDLIQQYEVSLSRMLNDILILDEQWLPNQSDFPPISWPLYRAWPSPILSGFHGAFAKGVACQQGTLTLPDTWFRPPLWDLLVLQLLRPDSSNLPFFTRLFTSNTPLYFLDLAWLQ